MRALSIRQPYAELILQGKTRIEYRSMRAKNLIGQPFYIYTSLTKKAERNCVILSALNARRRLIQDQASTSWASRTALRTLATISFVVS